MEILNHELWEESKNEATKKFGTNSVYKLVLASKLYKQKQINSLIKEKNPEVAECDSNDLKSIAESKNIPLSSLFSEYTLGLKTEGSGNIQVVKENLKLDPNYYSKLKSRSKTLSETPLDPNSGDFDIHQLDSMSSFRQRINYCTQYLEKIGQGSSRIVFKLNDKTVLKLAKNQKGIEQNSFEADIDSDIVTKVFDHDKLCTWVESELAKRISKSRFKQLTTFDINEVYSYLFNYYNEQRGKKHKIDINPDLYDRLDSSDFVIDLCVLMTNNDLAVGDLGRISSYGEINGHIMLVDYGASDDIMSSYYSKVAEAIKYAQSLYKKDLIEDKIPKSYSMRHWVRENWKFINQK